ncbi:carbonic anhydrase [Thelephora terrestris]|uniref:Carbonic anhydrase n=1 Tax=Thelephora terrestris TaxID=56493 RepID=A0A9P6HQL8_9AGAM|nr:carbonic anhydrase [Thelephora terrestris]
MFTKLFVPVLLVSSAVIPAFSLPAPLSPSRIFVRDNQGDNNSTQGNGNCSTSQNVVYLNDTASRFPDLVYLAAGNQDFRSAVANSSNPNLLQDLTTNGQHPEYLFLGCSDSRVSEGTIFSAPPGALFTQRNIGNQFQPVDNNAISVLSYGVQSLGVGHIIVMGHYGCGGVAAAMLPRPNTTDDPSRSSVQSWINPIRYTYLNSSRPEIVSFREANENKTSVDYPKFDDPGFRALVEENVKDSVFNILISPMMQQHWNAYIAQEQGQNGTTSSTRRSSDSSAPLKPVYVHGFVYDISTGYVTDLKTSFGPYGAVSQAPPQDAVKRAVAADQHAHGHVHL